LLSSILLVASMLWLPGCARHPLLDLELEDHDGPLQKDSGAMEMDDATIVEPDPDPMTDPDPQDPGDGDDTTPVEMPTSDASMEQPVADAGPVDPGAPHADNAGTCPKQKPSPAGQCISFVGQCRYGTDPVVECQCIAVGWLCN
jgi:hypothetical protein